MDVLGNVYSEHHYAATARNMQSVADADPGLVIYPAQQAFLWGLAANEGDADARQKAIETYERVITMTPYYAPYHANLAALYADAGRREDSLRTLAKCG